MGRLGGAQVSRAGKWRAQSAIMSRAPIFLAITHFSSALDARTRPSLVGRATGSGGGNNFFGPAEPALAWPVNQFACSASTRNWPSDWRWFGRARAAGILQHARESWPAQHLSSAAGRCWRAICAGASPQPTRAASGEWRRQRPGCPASRKVIRRGRHVQAALKIERLGRPC